MPDPTETYAALQKKVSELSDALDALQFSFWKKTGSGSAGITNTTLESTNFKTGSTGWQLTADGNLEANAGTFRGALTGNSLNIPDTTTANSFHVDSAGNTWWGATSLASAVAWVTKAGLATFKGVSTLNMKAYTCFETAGRFTKTLVGGGTVTHGTSGALFQTSATSGSSAALTWYLSGHMFDGSPTVAISIELGSAAAATGSAFFGLGDVVVDGTGHSYTLDHIGFKLIKTGSAITVYGTVGDGTEVATSALTTVTNTENLDLILKVNNTPATSVDFYVRKNVSGLSSAATLSSHVPTAQASNQMQFSVSNDSTATAFTLAVLSAALER